MGQNEAVGRTEIVDRAHYRGNGDIEHNNELERQTNLEHDRYVNLLVIHTAARIRLPPPPFGRWNRHGSTVSRALESRAFASKQRRHLNRQLVDKFTDVQFTWYLLSETDY